MLHGLTMIILGGWVLRLASLSLALAAFRLYQRALEQGMEPLHLAWLPPLGALLGWFKARRVMRRSLDANLGWLRLREAVPAWRIFPPRLLLFIACMIALMALLKLLAANHAPGLALLATLDLAVATALALSAGLHGPLLSRRPVTHEAIVEANKPDTG